MPQISIPEKLLTNFQENDDDRAWLKQLPEIITALQGRWALTLDAPFEEDVTCSWVATCTRTDGSLAVLKVGLPHMEARHEIEGLQFWAGNPTVFVREADIGLNAVLLERCQPGTTLRKRPEPEQDQVIAQLLRRLWRVPPEPHPFRPLSEMTAAWADEAVADKDNWLDAGLSQEGLRLFAELPQTATEAVLLATDLHAGNVLEAEREPWLVIDPKPFIGDPAYDATQHLFNCMDRLAADPDRLIRSFADLLEVDQERVRLWMFARLALTTWGDRVAAQTLARQVMNGF